MINAGEEKSGKNPPKNGTTRWVEPQRVAGKLLGLA
jgi:hypothetical protein